MSVLHAGAGTLMDSVAGRQPDSPLLPRIDLGNLFELADALEIDCSRNFQRQHAILKHFVSNDSCGLYELIRIFEQCEQHGMIEYLLLLYRCFRSLIMLQLPSLINSLFSNRFIMGVIGALEYDDDDVGDDDSMDFVPRRKHRDFLENDSKFIDVADLSSNPELADKIRQTYLVEYIQDAFFPNVATNFDEICTTSVLTSFIASNRNTIVSYIETEEDVFVRIRDKLKSPRDVTTTKNVLTFIQCLCLASRTMMADNRTSLHNTLLRTGIHEAVHGQLSSKDEDSRLCAIDILVSILHYSSPETIKSFVIDCDGPAQKCSLSIDNFLGNDQITKAELTERTNIVILLDMIVDSVAALFDPKNEHFDFMTSLIDAMKNDQDEYLKVGSEIATGIGTLIENTFSESRANSGLLRGFIKTHLRSLIEPVLSNVNADGIVRDDIRTAILVSSVLKVVGEILVADPYCIIDHFNSLNFPIVRLCKMLKSQWVIGRMAMIQFLKRFVRLCVNDIDRRLVVAGCLDHVLEALFNSGDDAMFKSSILDMFTFIRIEDRRILLSYLTRDCVSKWKSDDAVLNRVYILMKEKLDVLEEQSSEASESVEVSNITSRGFMTFSSATQISSEEEKYFDADDGESSEQYDTTREVGSSTPPKRRKSNNDEEDYGDVFSEQKQQRITLLAERKVRKTIDIRISGCRSTSSSESNGSASRCLVDYDLSSSSESEDE